MFKFSCTWQYDGYKSGKILLSSGIELSFVPHIGMEMRDVSTEDSSGRKFDNLTIKLTKVSYSEKYGKFFLEGDVISHIYI